MKEGCVSSCDIIVIGHLKWNPMFGESEDCPPRGDPSTCTSTMIRGTDRNGEPYVLIVDPTLRNSREEYGFDINRRTGLHLDDVTHCFITHDHFDHQVGVNYFPNARWMAAEEVVEALKDSEFIDGSRVEVFNETEFPGLKLEALPGHRLNLHGLSMTLHGKKILVAADSVMTRDHFVKKKGMFEMDSEKGLETIERIGRDFDIVIPGHDNWFWTKW